jgi:hypothetical protein
LDFKGSGLIAFERQGLSGVMPETTVSVEAASPLEITAVQAAAENKLTVVALGSPLPGQRKILQPSPPRCVIHAQVKNYQPCNQRSD